MARTDHRRKAPGTDWWGKRPYAGAWVNRKRGMKATGWKRLLHKAERNQAKREIRQEAP